MAKRKGLSRSAKIFWGLLAAVLIAITGIWGYNRYMEKKKVEQLYRYGFRLLEEQIATYIKENYSGISKIEFSPIFVDGDGRFTIMTVDVVPVVYDNYGNRSLLGTKIGNTSYGGYGVNGGLTLDFDISGNEIIYLEDFDNNKEIEVSNDTHLPDKAKLLSSKKIDDNMDALIEDKQLKDVTKSAEGSPEAEIVYNLKIKEGEYWKWR
ncbi:hypothetical protein DDV21_002450 [Streptococcus chenjunshii]|uniref:Uncharacterized protein n=1 Tax=Streptococcus chenjunshii TaxID=2173853 RepID=A0A372KKW5_9STRE|nr:hypothetical protein [Streptococcus chenjunshii]AXQ78012.1 hypothetical protein DDV21_002450 [Streptococcus chenjunshii]RFU51743.1 hypothetical protein DDV22_01315 [Streptococcus chenjunshii]RFU52218.1 hypothetical protein DDV23_10860 [Streptococcus chenjunshii]